MIKNSNDKEEPVAQYQNLKPEDLGASLSHQEQFCISTERGFQSHLGNTVKLTKLPSNPVAEILNQTSRSSKLRGSGNTCGFGEKLCNEKSCGYSQQKFYEKSRCAHILDQYYTYH